MDGVTTKVSHVPAVVSVHCPGIHTIHHLVRETSLLRRSLIMNIRDVLTALKINTMGRFAVIADISRRDNMEIKNWYIPLSIAILIIGMYLGHSIALNSMNSPLKTFCGNNGYPYFNYVITDYDIIIKCQDNWGKTSPGEKFFYKRIEWDDNTKRYGGVCDESISDGL